MTRSEMHIEFKLLMDKAGEGGSPSFTASEIDRFLNMAQERFVSKRAFGNNPRGTGFEEDQKRRDDLRSLIVGTTLNPETGLNIGLLIAGKPNSTFFKLPPDYRHAIQEEVIKDLSDLDARTPVKPISHDRYNKIVDDPFNKPTKNTVYRLGLGRLTENEDFVELVHAPGETIANGYYVLRYIKNPLEIDESQDCMLPNHTHREIIRMAVVDALETVEQPRYQSSKIELNEIE